MGDICAVPRSRSVPSKISAYFLDCHDHHPTSSEVKEIPHNLSRLKLSKKWSMVFFINHEWSIPLVNNQPLDPATIDETIMMVNDIQ